MVLISFKLFKKEGLFIWAALAPVLANIFTLKNANIFGLNCTCGSVLFASIFLVTDIISERYNEKESKKAIYIGVFSNIVLIISSQIALRYIPSNIDIMNNKLVDIFSLNLRVTISSIICFLLSNLLDVIIYNRLKKKTNNKLIWLRNNISTIICNCTENFLFIFLAYVGIFSIQDIIIIALSTSVIELIVAILDTPFLYIAKNIKIKEDTNA
jgi:uncharacterized integral membrane protein (TIGR00697 family)